MRLVVTTAVGLTFAGLVACSSPHFPKGPPPLYEDPPAPSWLDAGPPPGSVTPAVDAGAAFEAGVLPSM